MAPVLLMVNSPVPSESHFILRVFGATVNEAGIPAVTEGIGVAVGGAGVAVGGPPMGVIVGSAVGISELKGSAVGFET